MLWIGLFVGLGVLPPDCNPSSSVTNCCSVFTIWPTRFDRELLQQLVAEGIDDSFGPDMVPDKDEPVAAGVFVPYPKDRR